MSENEKKILDLSVSMPTEQEPPADIWGDDALGRKKFADDLTRIVKNAAEHKSFTLSLHGGWGTGKTYLLQRWQKQLQKEGRQAVYFNAWEDDFQADPLTAIVGQLWKEIKKGDFAEIGESLKSLVGHLGKKVLGVAGATEEDFQSSAERTVDEYLDVREKLDDLKKRLKELAKAVKDSTGFPLVFIVDELDRCKPTFAIEVLERVKHLFNAPNIAFVFGINKTELQESIQSAYGTINAEDYLRRFFDIGLTLPPADVSSYFGRMLKENDLDNALNHMQTIQSYRGDGQWIQATSDLSNCLIGYLGLSLREVEHVVRLLRFAMKSRIASNKVIAGEAWSMFLLVILKIKKPALYAEFISGKGRCAVVIDYFINHLPMRSVGPSGSYYSVSTTKEAAHMIEFSIYRFCRHNSEGQDDERENIIKGLECLKQGKSLDPAVADFLAQTTKKADKNHASHLLIAIEGDEHNRRKAAAALLDLTDDFRR